MKGSMMSRTFRKKDGYVPRWVVRTYDVQSFSYVPLEGKELKKSLHRYHGDHDHHRSPAHWWRQHHHQKFRAEAKQEIFKYLTSSEHEVQIRNNPRWPWWD
jgi:hypothetical protein